MDFRDFETLSNRSDADLTEVDTELKASNTTH
jgi:hypothetical protein